MKFDMVAPCPQCPFRSDVEPYLRTARVQGICESLIDRDASFSCHKTTRHDDEGEAIRTSEEQHCAGALIMLERMKMPNQMMRIAYKRWYDPTKLKMDSPVYDNTQQMIAAYRAFNNKTKG